MVGDEGNMEVQQGEEGGDVQVKLASGRVGFDSYISVGWGRE